MRKFKVMGADIDLLLGFVKEGYKNPTKYFDEFRPNLDRRYRVHFISGCGNSHHDWFTIRIAGTQYEFYADYDNPYNSYIHDSNVSYLRVLWKVKKIGEGYKIYSEKF